MKKTVKIIKHFLTILVIISIMVSCAKNNESSEIIQETKTNSEKIAAVYNDQDISEPVELAMYYIGDKTEDEDLVLDEINKTLKEKINATLSLKSMSLSDYSTKYALTIAGGEDFDLIYSSTWAFYQSEANKGAFTEITDTVLNSYMPLHKKNQAEASWGQSKIDGKVYFVPCNMAKVNANAVLIRGDLREKYGMERLVSEDDLARYFKEVATDKDSGVSFPYNASQHNDNLRKVLINLKNDWALMEGSLINYFTYEYSEDFTQDDVFWLFKSENYMDYAKQMKKWADEGYWSKSAIANATDPKESFLNGTSASYVQNLGTVGALASEVEIAHPEWKPEIYDLFPNTNRFLSSYTGDGIAVVANSKNQERAFMALDILKFDESLYRLVRHGIEGKHYEIVNETTWKPSEEMERYPYGNAFSWGFKNTMYDMTREGTFSDQVTLGEIWTDKALSLPTDAFSFDDTNVKNELANLQSVYTQYVPLLDLGLVDNVEETLIELNSKAEIAGLPKIKTEVIRQIEEYLKNK
ncbi:MAG: ABC transporter substrate-binding protein [Lachnospirales bacterium]